MSFVPGSDTLIVRGQWFNIDGSPASGKIQVQLENSTADQATYVLYTKKPVEYQLDGTGSVEFELIKTGGSDVDLSRSVAAIITENIDGARPYKWRTVISSDNLDVNGDFQLAAASEVTSRPLNQYVLLGAFSAGLASKANINSPTFTGTVGGITKSMVGLSNVDNTSDINKPVSNAVQTALNGKAGYTTVPASVTSAGVPGQIAANTTHLYICISPNVWRRVAISEW